ncbi:MAG: hypothetical protein RL662_1625 [Bacteroidota bacterium]|jgi:endonuclease/exonuclease/phosphatase family metal-dependent hydrolase
MQVESKRIFSYIKRTFKSIFLGINVFMFMLLLSSFLAWSISPLRTTLFAYLGLGFPFILTGMVLLTVFWGVLLNWKMVLINIVMMLVCYKPILVYVPLHFKTTTIPEGSLKVLSYNVRGFDWEMDKKWDDDRPIIDYIISVDADIICMQEYMASTDDRYASSKNLQKALKKYPYYSVTPLRSIKGGYEYGLACFSKYPIKTIFEIPVTSETNGSALYKIDVNGKVITVINNHFESNRLTYEDKKMYKAFLKDQRGRGPNLNDVTLNIAQRLGTAYKRRAPQIDLVAKYIKEQKTDATVVCGDFNDTPISYSYNTISETLSDSYAETAFGPGITYNENLFLFRIDYIFHSKNMKAYNCTVDKVKYSDHYPVWTYLHLQ